MFEVFVLIFVFLIFLVGLSEILHRLWVFFLSPSDCGKSYALTVLKSGSATQQIRAELEKIRWAGKGEYKGLICICDNLSDDEMSLCLSEAEKNADLFVVNFCELGKFYLEFGEDVCDRGS